MAMSLAQEKEVRCSQLPWSLGAQKSWRIGILPWPRAEQINPSHVSTKLPWMRRKQSNHTAMLWYPVFQEASEEEMLRAAMAMSLDQEEEVRSLAFTLIDLVYQGDQGEGGAKDSTMVEEEQALSGGAGGGGEAGGAGGAR